MSVAGSALAGAGLGFSLIVAIGAQNAYVLRMGIRREWVGQVVGLCAISDAVLIVAGVAGTDLATQAVPPLADAIRWGGAAFLIGYGLASLRRAFRPERLEAEGGGPQVTLRRALLTAAAFTWLNPHVYLDTLLLVGSVANGQGSGRWWFAAGAAGASLVWFSALGFGARLLAGVFARPVAWRILDLVIAATMVTIGGALLVT